MMNDNIPSLGTLLDQKMEELGLILERCSELTQRVTALEKDNSDLRAKLEAIMSRGSLPDNTHEDINPEQDDNPQFVEVYVSPRKTATDIELAIVNDRNMGQYAPFIMSYSGDNGEVNINLGFKCSRDNIETKLLSYVDYSIANQSSSSRIEQIASGNAVLVNGVWYMNQKPQIAIK